MKLLQVNNVATLLGGTGQCALSIRHALPDFEHRVHFFGMSDPEPYIHEEFTDAQLRCGTKITQEDLEWSDLVIFHNTAAINMPSRIPENCATLYYQHSRHGSVKASAAQCDLAVTVSHYLRGESDTKLDVLHQPVKMPLKSIIARDLGVSPVVIRFCTPNVDKWIGCEEMYREAFREYADSCHFWFVGAPPFVEVLLNEIADEHGAVVEFHPCGTSLRSELHRCDMLMYSSPLTETYGRTVCEAQMCGCVPIVDNRGGFREQIKHGRDGFLCNSIPEFMTAIDDVIYDRQRGFQMSQIAQISGSQRGSLVVWRDKFLNILRGKKC